MTGRIHSMIDTIIQRRAQGDPVAAAGMRVRLLLRGIDPDQYTAASEDDPAVIEKLQQMMSDPEMGA